MFRPAVLSAVALLVQIVLGPSALLIAQQEEPKPAEANKPEPESLKIEIADEPKTIDPATLLPEELATPATVEFTEASLKEVLNWIKTERKISVVLDEAALTESNILVSEPVTDRLNNEPLYLLLNRLKSLQLAWYMEGKILHITTEVKADSIMKTVPHNLGEFFDAGFKPQAMTQTIMQATGGLWEEDGDGEGHLILLGDVVFLRQTDKVHLEVEGLLSALRKHGRRTYVLDPPQHEILRQKLEQVISVDFQDTPLFAAIQELSRQVEADIRLDKESLQAIRIRDREPVTLSLTEQKLSVVLTALL
ncbi:MAG: hypothetical protein ACKVT0_18540, partial [Planctomycetaceae bacterium]